MSRGFVPPAVIVSTIVLCLCALGWGALGVIAAEPNVNLDPELGRYLNMLLITTTLSSVLVNMFARLVRTLRVADDGYAAGYADGLDARPAAAPVSPAVARLVRSPR